MRYRQATPEFLVAHNFASARRGDRTNCAPVTLASGAEVAIEPRGASRLMAPRLPRQQVLLASPALWACGFAVAWFFYLGFGPTLDPRRIQWMLRDDWATYLWGFSFFRNAPWGLPLGAVPDLLWPEGTSVGFTDANPWLSVLFKLLSPVLPADFQFCGLWFLSCFVLLAWFGTRIAASFTPDRVQQALGGCLFAVTPLIPSRHSHITLCGFFLLAAALQLNLAPVPARRHLRRVVGWAAALLIWAGGTHAYLAIMVLALLLALWLRLRFVDALLSTWQLCLLMGLSCGALLATFWLFGYLGWRPVDLSAEGFGRFSGDLTALINPQHWSRLLPSRRVANGEGYGYLGFGVLTLLVLGAVHALRSRREAVQALGRRWPLLAAVSLMALYSLLPAVTLRGEVLLDLSAWLAPFERWTGIFRGNGRFIWPLNLALTAAAIAVATNLRDPRRARLALGLALALQAGELKRERFSFHDVPLQPLSHPAWQALGQYRHLEAVPAQLLWLCRYDPALVNRLSHAAYHHKLTFNSGNPTRAEPGMRERCERQFKRRTALDRATVYIVEPEYAAAFRPRNAVCGTLDGLFTCVSKSNPTALTDALRAGQLSASD